jgi:hypothetical protein
LHFSGVSASARDREERLGRKGDQRNKLASRT